MAKISSGWLLLGAVLCAGTLAGGCRREAAPRPGARPPQKQQVGTVALPPPGEGVGKPAPDFSVEDIDGARHSLGDYRGRILVIDFWAIYNRTCVRRLAEYKEKCADYRSRDVDFLALSLDETDESVRDWRQRQPEGAFPFPLARVDDQTRKAFFGDTAMIRIPQVRIVDGKGVVRYALGRDNTTEQVLAAVQTLLDEKR